MSAKRDILAEIHCISQSGDRTYYSMGIYDTAQDLAEHVLCQQNNRATASVMVIVPGVAETFVKFSKPSRYVPSAGWHERHTLFKVL
jgi:hypothetical protein